MSFILQHFSPLLLVWLLIVIFTGSRDHMHSYREALICTVGLAAISMIFAWVIPSPYHLLRFPVQVFALFFLIERVCECARATTWRIVIWYAALSILFALSFHAFSEFIKQPVEWHAPSD
jgi:hypothetical protein